MSIQYSVRVLEYPKVQAREANSVSSCINTSDLYKSCFTSVGLYPCLLDVALLCCPIRIRKDQEVSQQCASSTMPSGLQRSWAGSCQLEIFAVSCALMHSLVAALRQDQTSLLVTSQPLKKVESSIGAPWFRLDKTFAFGFQI